MSFKNFFKDLGMILATTIGAGIFVLPYVFRESGWVISLFYLLIFSGLVATVHLLYWRVLFKEDGKKRLLGLIKAKLGNFSFGLALVSVLGGLIFALVAFLILGGKFLGVVFPGLGENIGILIFWAASSLPLIFSLKRIVKLELMGGILMVLIVGLIFASALSSPIVTQVKDFDFGNLFLPFGAILFSLAGWTAIEPIYDSYKKHSMGMNFAKRGLQFVFATYAAALVYLFFVLAIFNSASAITPDTISGLGNWSSAKLGVLGVFGLFALWTSYLPIGREVENLLIKDLGKTKFWSLVAVIFLPLILVFAGLKNFLVAVSMVGGIFLASQYFFLAVVSERVLKPRRLKKFLIYLVALVFLLGVVYEIYYFVIR
ncbi:MAG: hypothetical protein AAB738_00640 [Patescibacteria group bacterium]